MNHAYVEHDSFIGGTWDMTRSLITGSKAATAVQHVCFTAVLDLLSNRIESNRIESNLIESNRIESNLITGI